MDGIRSSPPASPLRARLFAALQGVRRRRATIARYAVALAALLALVAVLRGFEVFDRAFIYFPSRAIERTPADAGLDFEDVTFQASDGVSLHGWHIPAPDAVATLVWFHGNGGNISHRVDNIRELVRRLNVNVFIFDYRGYGRSEGSPDEQGTYLDGEAALEQALAHPDVDADRVVYFGRSLGCAVAAEMALRRPPLALICESGFTSIPAMASSAYPFIPGLRFLVTTKYDALAKIRGVRAPVMIAHGDRDEIVPFAMGRELFAAAPDPKRFLAIPGAMHNDTYHVGGPPYFEAMGLFLHDVIAGRLR